jgi:AraC family transcriptional regulator
MSNANPIIAEYKSRINKTLDYIERNPDKPITLEELAGVANFSKFHFNRIFHSIVGETPFQFILRFRLEKAASLILTNRNKSITEIAEICGFSNVSIFSRNFRNYFKISATQYRKDKLINSNSGKTNSNTIQDSDTPLIYLCPDLQTIKWRTNMKLNKNVEVKELPKMTVVYVRNIGPYNGDQKLFQNLRDKLFSWAGARGLFMGKDCRFLVVYHDDPTVAISDKLRMSLCLTVPPETKVDGEIGKMEIESAKYVVARFELTGKDFQNAWNWVYGQWLPNSGYQPDDKPYFEMYNEPPKDGNYVIDFCVPVKPL